MKNSRELDCPVTMVSAPGATRPQASLHDPEFMTHVLLNTVRGNATTVYSCLNKMVVSKLNKAGWTSRQWCAKLKDRFQRSLTNDSVHDIVRGTAIDSVLLAKKMVVERLNEAAIDFAPVVVPLSELQSVQTFLPVAIAYQVRAHEISRAVRAACKCKRKCTCTCTCQCKCKCKCECKIVKM